MIKVQKRNGNLVDFDMNKIRNAITRAFDSVGQETSGYIMNDIIDYLKFPNNDCKDNPIITVEEIQDQVENALLNLGYFNVAKAYILYRAEHAESRFIRERLEYMNKYINSGDNAATASETDSNANVTMKNVANLEGEVYKVKNRIIQRQRMKNKLNELYPEVAKQYEKDLENSIIYAHDEATSPALKAYTYSSKEVVEVLYNGKTLLLPLDLLYQIVDENEVNVEEGVYQKKPWHLYVKDNNNNYTKVTYLTKKKRHRDLVRIKTAFGEDIVVTDNHPMITDINNPNDSLIPAIDSLGERQYRIGTRIKFKGKKTIDLCSFLPTYINAEKTFIKYQQSVLKRIIEVNEQLGYIIGFFIGDGNYDNTAKCLNFTQKEIDVLNTINEYCFNIFGIAGKINKDSKYDKYQLSIHNQYLYELFRGYFKIQDKAQNKTIPYNILEFNEDFALGILAGLIDSDGTIKYDNCAICIRLSSRACILQCTCLFRHFGYSIGNEKQSLPFSNNNSYHTNYTIWGITATKRESSVEIPLSFKVKNNLINSKATSLKYHTDGYCNITSVDKIEKESAFLLQNEYIYDITTESHTFVCNNLLVHNCLAATLYPLMLEGSGNIDGVTPTPPNDIQSFNGQVTNLVFLLSSQVRGAVALGDYIIALNYYVVKEFGDRWYDILDKPATSEYNNQQRTVKSVIRKGMKTYIYGVNQPAGNRSYNSPFSNISFYDKYYFNALFDGFAYPDGTRPEWKQIDVLQRIFMELLRELRLIKPLTFPVTTMALLHDGHDCLDKEYKELCAEEWAKGGSFFCYMNDNPSALSSCCRLSNEITDNVFSSTIGMTGIMTGSCNVITLNINRIVQNYVRENGKFDKGFDKYFTDILGRVYKYQIAYKTMLYDMEDKKMYSCCNAGYIFMKKLYSTIGVIGYYEAAKFLGYNTGDKMDADTNKYVKFLQFVFSIIQRENRKHSIHDKKHPIVFNIEAIPGEDLAIKFYKRDKCDGYTVPADQNLYNSYFYSPWGTESVLDKLKLHGKEVCKYLSGGQACHINLDAHLSKEQYLKIIDYCIREGVNYFTFNIPISECKDCGHIVNAPITECPICHSKKIDWWTRVIGYLRAVSMFSKGRQIEASKRIYSNGKNEIK